MKEIINEQIKQNLFSPKTDIVVSAINSIKEKGNKLYIPILFDVLITKPEPEVELEIVKLLETVKDKDSVNAFVQAVENKKYKSIRKIILTACWQNGLDFSTFLPVFIDVIINDDWENAFEAFTIIDNLEYLPNKNIIKLAGAQIDKAFENADEQKKYFLQEIRVKLGI